MNCQEFEKGIGALARGALSDARTRAEALAHEESCANCAARLADERALSAGLRALATGMQGAEAPPRVEAALLAAFRARAASAAPAAANASAAAAASITSAASEVEAVKLKDAGRGGNVVALASRAEVKHWSWAKTVAVASLAAAASLALFVLARPDAGMRVPGAAGEVAGRGAQSKALETPRGEAAPRPLAEVAHRAEEAGDSSPVASPEPIVVRDKSPRATFAPRARAVNASYGTNGGRGGSPSQTARAAAGRSQEVVTDFIPLMQGSQFAQAEGGQLVRVELPRTALASFGLPVNAEVAGGRVKADVLLGEDGIARAIRFVR